MAATKKLSADDLAAGRFCFVEWLAQPTARRRPRTKTAVAQSLGVCQSLLLRWKAEPLLRLEVFRSISFQLYDHFEAVIKAVEEKALKARVPAAIGRYMELFRELGSRLPELQSKEVGSSRQLRPPRGWNRIASCPLEYLADVVEEVVEKAKKGDVAAARLFFYLDSMREPTR